MLQGTCLCLSGQGQATVVYCYGDPSARNIHQLGPDPSEDGIGGVNAIGQYTILDIAQMGVYTIGILAMYV